MKGGATAEVVDCGWAESKVKTEVCAMPRAGATRRRRRQRKGIQRYPEIQMDRTLQ
jgi:hypothetical protein